MLEIAEKKWAELPPIWEPLYNDNWKNMPFQDYAFLHFTGKGKPYRKDLFRLMGVKELNLVLYKDDQAIAIAPLLVRKKADKSIVYFRGHFTTACVLDFIYVDWSYEDFEFLMTGICDRLGNVSFFLDRVCERSVTSGYLKRYLSVARVEEHECFSIPVPATYDEWLGTLSKSARRNLRYSSHRLEKDNVSQSFRVYCGQPVDKKMYKKLMFVYADRFIIKNGIHLGPLYRLVRSGLVQYLTRDQMTRWLNTAENNFHAVLFLNGEVGAFASGLLCKDQRIILNRLAMYTKFSKYSPGGLLIRSMMEHIAENDGMDIEHLDLSQGNGDYKAYYGGALYHKYTYYCDVPSGSADAH